jgi:hypothetical protein
MPGSYYFSTPIGQGMSNLAQAISSMPEREAKAGLLAQRQRLLDEQALNEVAQRDEIRSRTRYHDAQAAGVELTTEGKRRGGDAFVVHGTTGNSGGSVAETATAPSPTDLASTILSDYGGSDVRMARQAVPVMPAAVPSMAPAALRSAGGGATGVTDALVRDLARYGMYAGMAPEKALQMYAGGRAGAASPDTDTAFSYVAGGAGEDFGHTIRGTREAAAQKASQFEREQRMRKYEIDTRNATDIQRAHIQADAPKRGKGKDGKPEELNEKERDFAQRKFRERAIGAGKLQPGDELAVMKRISQRVQGGQDFVEAVTDTLDDAFTYTPGEDHTFWFDKDPKTEFNPAYRKPASGTTGAPGPAASAPASVKPVAKWPTTAPPAPPRDKMIPGSFYRMANGKIARFNGQDDFDVQP